MLTLTRGFSFVDVAVFLNIDLFTFELLLSSLCGHLVSLRNEVIHISPFPSRAIPYLTMFHQSAPCLTQPRPPVIYTDEVIHVLPPTTPCLVTQHS